jgi:membrane protease subunit HflC
MAVPKEAADMRHLTTILIVAALAVLMALSSIFIISEGQTAIVLNLGKIVRSDLKPGLHFKWPVVEDVRKFDRRILSLDDAPERYLTAEKKDVEVDYFVKWRIKDVTTFYKNANGGDEEAAKQRLSPIVKNALRNEINQLALSAVVSSGRSDLTGRLLETINVGASTLGIEVLDLRIKRINLPQDSDILDSVFNRMRAERTRVANQLRAEGTQGAEGIRAEAERQRQVILADAERDAQKLRGEGDASAAEISAAAYGQDAEFYSFYRSLEAYRASLADGRTVMVLDPNSDFLRYFGHEQQH